MRSAQRRIPPGQRARQDFPRFGLPALATRWPDTTGSLSLHVGGEVDVPSDFSAEDLRALPRNRQISDFHCVTTWSKLGLPWRGYRFSDLYHQLIVPRVRPRPGVTFVLFEGLDGYRASLPLDDALAPSVLLADELDEQTLSADHGAPLRVVAPDHYGYKSVKHLCAIQLLSHRPSGSGGWKEHPRGRVELEERADVGLLPGWVFRWLNRPVVPFVAWYFRRTARQRDSASRR